MQAVHVVKFPNQANRLYAHCRVLLLEQAYASPSWLQWLLASTVHLAPGSPRTVFERNQTVSFRLPRSATTQASTTDFPFEPDDDPGARGIAVRSIFVPQQHREP